jgi:hypothetical protein
MQHAVFGPQRLELLEQFILVHVLTLPVRVPLLKPSEAFLLEKAE